MIYSHPEIKKRIKHNSVLAKVHALIDWNSLKSQLTGLYQREFSRGGPNPFDPLMMFKATLLGQWHNLSDPKLEEALRVRIDFMVFCGLDWNDDVPDETTLCRFRNRLIKAGRLDGLLKAINEQLGRHQLLVQKAQGAIIDATLIAAAARPKRETTLEMPEKDGKEKSSEPLSIIKKESADPDASWVKKGKRSYFGYRAHIIVDTSDTYIRGVHTVTASQSETKHFSSILANGDFRPERVYADKGYASKANRNLLRQQKIKSAIMYKACRNKPLKETQKKANGLISKLRSTVERCFGTIKRLFNLQRASYFGISKVNAQFTLKAICMNLLKAANKIQLNNKFLQER